jgi:hypothetical protein
MFTRRFLVPALACVCVFSNQAYPDKGGSPVLTYSPTTLNFGPTTVGTRTGQDVILTNNTNQTVYLTYQLSGPFSFSVLENEPSLIGHSYTPVLVYFTPPAVGSFTGSLTITWTQNDKSSGTISIPLSGTGM